MVPGSYSENHTIMNAFFTKSALICTAIGALLFSGCSPKLMKTANDFAESGNYPEAIEQYTNVIKEKPDYVDAYIKRAEAYWELEEYNEASLDYKRATTFERDDADLYAKAGEGFYLLENYEEAIPLLSKAVKLDEDRVAPYNMLIESYLAMEAYAQALKVTNDAISAHPDKGVFYYQRGYINQEMENLAQAETDFKKALSLQFRDAMLYCHLAQVLRDQKKYEEALTTCSNGLSQDERNVDLLMLRADIYHKKLDYPNAINDLSKRIIFAPDDAEAFFQRGIYYQEFNQHQSAINDFSKVLSLSNDFAPAYYHRGLSYEEITNYSQAISDFEKYSQLVESDEQAQKRLSEVKERLYELNRESEMPEVVILNPSGSSDNILDIAEGELFVTIEGKVLDKSPLQYAKFEGNDVEWQNKGNGNHFKIELEVDGKKTLTFAAADIYNNVLAKTFSIRRTETDAPRVQLMAPYASANGEVYLANDLKKLYIEGEIEDASLIKRILVNEMNASYQAKRYNPDFFATIDITNKDTFVVEVEDMYGNITRKGYTINREGIDIAEENPMGKTWVVFIENSNYKTFASLEGPIKDISMMKAALANYKIHNIIHKKDMSKQDMQRFFSIELRDLVRSNHVNSLLVWYAGHGKYQNETGYWVPIDAKRDDEFTFYNINTLKAALQGYSNVTHTLVITDACESGPTFYQAMRSVPKERDCSDWYATKFKSSQVFSSAGYELAMDNSQFTRTFANSLVNNPDACLPIENIVTRVTVAVSKSGQQKPQFGKIAGLEDEGGTFFFMSK